MLRIATVLCLAVVGGPWNIGEAAIAAWQLDEPQVVVLSNLSVLRGDTTLTARGLRLETSPGSHLELPHQQIWALAATLDEAYLQIAPRLRLDEDAELQKLFRWCLQNQLLERAAALVSVAQTESRPAAVISGMQTELEQALAAAELPPRPAATSLPLGQPAPAAADRDREIDQTLAGLPRNAERFFNRELQPKLLSSCATAGCHQAPREGLALWHDGSGHVGIRAHSRRNLFQVLQWIDRNQPANSELLARVRTAHGAPASESWDAAAPSYQLLEYWVYAVSRDPSRYYNDVVLPSLAGQLPERSDQFSAAAPMSASAAAQPEIATVGFEEIPSPVPPEKLIEPATPPPAVELVPCDPLPFNRKYHPGRREK